MPVKAKSRRDRRPVATPAMPADPLGDSLRSALETERDPQVRELIERLIAGDRAPTTARKT